MSGYFQFHETNFVDALHCGNVLPVPPQNNSPSGAEVNSEAYSCSILQTFEEFGCLTSGIIF